MEKPGSTQERPVTRPVTRPKTARQEEIAIALRALQEKEHRRYRTIVETHREGAYFSARTIRIEKSTMNQRETAMEKKVKNKLPDHFSLYDEYEFDGDEERFVRVPVEYLFRPKTSVTTYDSVFLAPILALAEDMAFDGSWSVYGHGGALFGYQGEELERRLFRWVEYNRMVHFHAGYRKNIQSENSAARHFCLAELSDECSQAWKYFKKITANEDVPASAAEHFRSKWPVWLWRDNAKGDFYSGNPEQDEQYFQVPLIFGGEKFSDQHD